MDDGFVKYGLLTRWVCVAIDAHMVDLTMSFVM
jgi:hypothetical protein